MAFLRKLDKLFQNPVKIRKWLNLMVQIKAMVSSHSGNISGNRNAMGKPTACSALLRSKAMYLS